MPEREREKSGEESSETVIRRRVNEGTRRRVNKETSEQVDKETRKYYEK
ncbi:hypothetical protein LJC68_07965 [Bacteroidales bacterium OttesenSCG-928-B11]|nr:hypothetical protein [Bacteroidales bacterium OttesenSCG-928-C03]MDL2312795.1 hypothetical protein [Bacteroidales bacterium OttesenSCG-928-B11]MDL2325879.1 hypothetical protein [Bacteroidales bacterium OttesenSCG-928-A14]